MPPPVRKKSAALLKVRCKRRGSRTAAGGPWCAFLSAALPVGLHPGPPPAGDRFASEPEAFPWTKGPVRVYSCHPEAMRSLLNAASAVDSPHCLWGAISSTVPSTWGQHDTTACVIVAEGLMKTPAW